MIKPHWRERALESRQSVYWPKDKPPSILDGFRKLPPVVKANQRAEPDWFRIALVA